MKLDNCRELQQARPGLCQRFLRREPLGCTSVVSKNIVRELPI